METGEVHFEAEQQQVAEFVAPEDWQGLGKLEMVEAGNSRGRAAGRSDSRKPEMIWASLTSGSVRNFAGNLVDSEPSYPRALPAEGRPD